MHNYLLLDIFKDSKKEGRGTTLRTLSRLPTIGLRLLFQRFFYREKWQFLDGDLDSTNALIFQEFLNSITSTNWQYHRSDGT